MYKRLLIGLFCLLLLGFPCPVWAREVGSIRVITNYLNARVFLDGELRGAAPMVLEEVPWGRHTLTLEGAGCDPFVQTVELKSGSLVVQADLHSNLEGIMILRPIPDLEPRSAPVSLYLTVGCRPDGGWNSLGIGRSLWSLAPFELLFRGAGMTGVTSKVPYYGLYLEPSLLLNRSLRMGLTGYGGIGCRGSLVSYRGLEELRNYLTGNLVLGIGCQAWFGEARCGILRQQGDPTRTVEVGIGRVF